MTFQQNPYDARKAATLWMGDIDPYMDDVFIINAFKQAMNRTDNVIKDIKFPINKATGMPMGYCFIEFYDADMAKVALQAAAGKTIPNSNPPKRWKLNTSGDRSSRSSAPTWSVWVGDLDPSVDEPTLLNHFARRFTTIVATKICTDRNTGMPRGFAFVRFNNQADQQRAMEAFDGTQINGKTIKVRAAQAKETRSFSTYTQSQPVYSDPSYQNMYPGDWYGTSQYQQKGYDELEDPDALIEQVLFDDATQINSDFVSMSGEVYTALDDSRWCGPAHPSVSEQQTYTEQYAT